MERARSQTTKNTADAFPADGISGQDEGHDRTFARSFSRRDGLTMRRRAESRKVKVAQSLENYLETSLFRRRRQ